MLRARLRSVFVCVYVFGCVRVLVVEDLVMCTFLVKDKVSFRAFGEKLESRYCAFTHTNITKRCMDRLSPCFSFKTPLQLRIMLSRKRYNNYSSAIPQTFIFKIKGGADLIQGPLPQRGISDTCVKHGWQLMDPTYMSLDLG